MSAAQVPGQLAGAGERAARLAVRAGDQLARDLAVVAAGGEDFQRFRVQQQRAIEISQRDQPTFPEEPVRPARNWKNRKTTNPVDMSPRMVATTAHTK